MQSRRIFTNTFLLKSQLFLQGLYAVPPGNHGDDVQHYFPELEYGLQINVLLRRYSLTLSVFSSPIADDLFYNSTIFSTSFSGGFLGFVKFDDPNKHTLPDSKLPEWGVYDVDKSKTEMLFNRTADFQPDIRTISTDSGLLERCE